MNNINFYNNLNDLGQHECFLAEIGNICNEEDLFIDLKNGLMFPDYFGFNWNATYECLTDFHWIKEKMIIIIHNENLNIEKSILSIYMQVLESAIDYWRKNNDHSLIIFFPEEMKNKFH